METNKQDQILSAIGLKRLMVWTPAVASVYDRSKFVNYTTSEYKESLRKESDEIYGMFELNLLHADSGLRLTLTTRESYDGETVEYKVVRMFIVTPGKKESEVTDADFDKRKFYTSDSEIPFSETSKFLG